MEKNGFIKFENYIKLQNYMKVSVKDIKFNKAADLRPWRHSCRVVACKLLKTLSTNFTKWSNTLKQFVRKLSTNCLSVFDHFVGLALKGLRWTRKLLRMNADGHLAAVSPLALIIILQKSHSNLLSKLSYFFQRYNWFDTTCA